MRALLVLACLAGGLCAPAYFAPVANRVLRFSGGAGLGPLDVSSVAQLEQQVKRVLGADPSKDLNVSAVCDLPGPEILALLLLAVLGNFTTAAADGPDFPCALAIDPADGRVVPREAHAGELLPLQVVTCLLIAVQFGDWLYKRPAPEPPAK